VLPRGRRGEHGLRQTSLQEKRKGKRLPLVLHRRQEGKKGKIVPRQSCVGGGGEKKGSRFKRGKDHTKRWGGGGENTSNFFKGKGAPAPPKRKGNHLKGKVTQRLPFLGKRRKRPINREKSQWGKKKEIGNPRV